MAKSLRDIIKKIAHSSADEKFLKFHNGETLKPDAPTSRDSQFDTDVKMFDRHIEHGYNPGEDEEVYDSFSESLSKDLRKRFSDITKSNKRKEKSNQKKNTEFKKNSVKKRPVYESISKKLKSKGYDLVSGKKTITTVPGYPSDEVGPKMYGSVQWDKRGLNYSELTGKAHKDPRKAKKEINRIAKEKSIKEGSIKDLVTKKEEGNLSPAEKKKLNALEKLKYRSRKTTLDAVFKAASDESVKKGKK